MIKEFLRPDFRKLITYLVFVFIFLTEIFLIRFLYQRDYMVEFVSKIYYSYLTIVEDYVSFFATAFSFYIFILAILYLLSCIVIFIIEKIKK